MRRQPVNRQIILLLLIMVAQTYAQKVGDKTTMQEKGYEVMEIRDRRRELPAQSLLDDDRGGGDSVRAGENVAMI